MSVVARFYVSETTRRAYQPQHLEVSLQAVSRGPENKTWAAATPAGQIKLTISNEQAAKWFADRLGKDIGILFEDRSDTCTRCGKNAGEGLSQYQDLISRDGKVVCIACSNEMSGL